MDGDANRKYFLAHTTVLVREELVVVVLSGRLPDQAAAGRGLAAVAPPNQFVRNPHPTFTMYFESKQALTKAGRDQV